jgi:hypothetical protein
MEKREFVEVLRALAFSPNATVGAVEATSAEQRVVELLAALGLNSGQCAVVTARVMLRIIEVSDAGAVPTW